MKAMLLLCRITLVFLLVSCGQDLIEIGTDGGSCRLTPMPCDEGLVCSSGKCRVDESSVRPNLEIVVDLSKRTLIADGEEELDIQLLINREEGGEPFSGDLLLYADPAGVGTLSSSLLNVDAGFGSATYRSCNRRNDGICPELLTFKLALPDTPNEPIFESEIIRQLSPSVESPTRLQTDICRGAVGSHVGLTIPSEGTERIESSETNGWTGRSDTLSIVTESANVTVAIPDQRINSYHALSPQMVQAVITHMTDTMQESASETSEVLSSCLSDGVWVGHQQLEFWTEEDSEQNMISHILSVLELDCIDSMNGYAVIRACAHGTQ